MTGAAASVPPGAGDGPAAARAVFGFRSTWGGAPTHLARAPGRVNLIGEHIDYCGLPVLPFALDAAIWVASGPTTEGRVRIATETEGLAPVEFETRVPIPPDQPGHWGNYVRAAAETLADGESPGFDAFIASDLPIAAGLSSSSALVVASALSSLAARGRTLPPVGAEENDRGRVELASRLAEGERYVGTAGGGMDQAACLLGRRGTALHLAFAPFRMRRIELPEDWRFVIAHSGEEADKSGLARETYNRRTREAGTAAAAMWGGLGVGIPAGGALLSYPLLLDRLEPDELWHLADEVLDGTLAMRFRHVVTEARRVGLAVDAIARVDLTRLGGLMLESHASLRDDYVVSTAALNALVEAALAGGATGARLTGAGLGGCIVAVCSAGVVDQVLEALRSKAAGGRAFDARSSDGAEVRTL